MPTSSKLGSKHTLKSSQNPVMNGACRLIIAPKHTATGILDRFCLRQHELTQEPAETHPQLNCEGMQLFCIPLKFAPEVVLIPVIDNMFPMFATPSSATTEFGGGYLGHA